ncbi:MAG: response regulator [Calditrichia bacterium]
MEKPEIICIDDQREILAALAKDLEPLRSHFSLTFCESANEAEEVIDEFDAEGKPIALILCDHVMPGKNGVDFMIDLNKQARFSTLKKILLTGQATHRDTIVAINEAAIDRYIEKPWKQDDLLKAIRVLITEFLFHSGNVYQTYIEQLDQQTLYRLLRKNS